MGGAGDNRTLSRVRGQTRQGRAARGAALWEGVVKGTLLREPREGCAGMGSACGSVLVSSAKWPTGTGQRDGVAESSQRPMEPVLGDPAQGLGLASALLRSSRNHSSEHVPVSSKLWGTCPPAWGSVPVSHVHVLLTGPGHK